MKLGVVLELAFAEYHIKVNTDTKASRLHVEDSPTPTASR